MGCVCRSGFSPTCRAEASLSLRAKRGNPVNQKCLHEQKHLDCHVASLLAMTCAEPGDYYRVGQQIDYKSVRPELVEGLHTHINKIPFALSLSKGHSWFDKLTTNSFGYLQSPNGKSGIISDSPSPPASRPAHANANWRQSPAHARLRAQAAIGLPRAPRSAHRSSSCGR